MPSSVYWDTCLFIEILQRNNQERLAACEDMRRKGCAQPKSHCDLHLDYCGGQQNFPNPSVPFIAGATFLSRAGRVGGTVRSAAGAEAEALTVLRDFYPSSQIGTSRRAAGFYSVPGPDGGRIWVGQGEFAQENLAELGRPGGGPGGTTIISGAHGTLSGAMQLDRRLFLEDVGKWYLDRGISLIDVGTLTTDAALAQALNRPGRIIFAVCIGERSQALLRALEAMFRNQKVASYGRIPRFI